MSTLPLEGILVLDLSRILAGPFCTMQLADLGAEVIKVEPPVGDDTRRFAPPWVGEGEAQTSSYYLSINRGKRSIVVDLKQDAGRAIIHELAAKADVVVENFRTGVTERLGVDYETLRAKNSKLVYVSVSGYGRDGDPDWAKRPGYDLVAQGLGGLPALTGPEDGAPYKVGASIADVTAGMTATQGVLAALLRRERTGEGGVVDISMVEVQLSLLAYHASSWLMAGVAPTRLGNQHPSLHPYSTYEASDGWLNIAVGNEPLFARFSAACGHPEWAEDPRFATNPDRVHHRAELDAVITEAMAGDTVDGWIARLAEAGVPCGPVLEVPDALSHPQVLARGAIVETEHPELGALKAVANAVYFPGLPRAASAPPPGVGEHTREVLAEVLGKSDGDVDALVASGAVS